MAGPAAWLSSSAEISAKRRLQAVSRSRSGAPSPSSYAFDSAVLQRSSKISIALATRRTSARAFEVVAVGSLRVTSIVAESSRISARLPCHTSNSPSRERSPAPRARERAKACRINSSENVTMRSYTAAASPATYGSLASSSRTRACRRQRMMITGSERARSATPYSASCLRLRECSVRPTGGEVSE